MPHCQYFDPKGVNFMTPMSKKKQCGQDYDKDVMIAGFPLLITDFFFCPWLLLLPVAALLKLCFLFKTVCWPFLRRSSTFLCSPRKFFFINITCNSVRRNFIKNVVCWVRLSWLLTTSEVVHKDTRAFFASS